MSHKGKWNTGYHRKFAICLLNGLVLENNQKRRVRRRKLGYGHEVLSILTAVWEAAGYRWSVAFHRELRMRMCRTEQTTKRRLSCAVQFGGNRKIIKCRYPALNCQKKSRPADPPHDQGQNASAWFSHCGYSLHHC